MDPPPDSLVDFTLDERRLPIITVRFPERVTIPGYEALFERYIEICARQTGIAWIIDMRRFNPVTGPAPVRKAAAEIFARARDQILRSTVCEARIVASMPVRGVLTAFDWLTGSKWPVKNVSSAIEAEAWVADELRKSKGGPKP